MELDAGVEGDVAVEDRLAQPRDGVVADGEEEEGVGEAHAGGAAPRQAHPVAEQTPQAAVLLLHGVDCGRDTQTHAQPHAGQRDNNHSNIMTLTTGTPMSYHIQCPASSTNKRSTKIMRKFNRKIQCIVCALKLN